jgi:hypothetical protein
MLWSLPADDVSLGVAKLTLALERCRGKRRSRLHPACRRFAGGLSPDREAEPGRCH